MISIQGKAVPGFICWTSCALPFIGFFCFGLLFLFQSEDPMTSLFIIVSSCALSAVPLKFAHEAWQTKVVEIDQHRVRLYYGNKLWYDIRIKDILYFSADWEWKVATGGAGIGFIFPPCIWRRFVIYINLRDLHVTLFQDRFIGETRKLQQMVAAIEEQRGRDEQISGDPRPRKRKGKVEE